VSNELHITFQDDLVVPYPSLWGMDQSVMDWTNRQYDNSVQPLARLNPSSTAISSTPGFSPSSSKASQDYGGEGTGNG
jgi:hypothetical protein